MMRKNMFRMFLGAGVVVVALVLLWVWLVIVAPGSAIRQENIERILAVESPVYYSDGITKIGVFFQQSHRQYVPYEEIPREFVNALLAAEDRNFFHHHGVDLPGIMRAMAANIMAGRVVQGGSTITQQAAKNLFKRKDRSLAAKLQELLYAWRLEYYYPKEKILEFYANQFYVSGNGRGLGVAARYFFDKSVAELDALECAFIAGSLKRPNYYNPFTKADDAGASLARQRAKARAGYVLSQMQRQGFISVAGLQQHVGREVPFRQGQMYYTLNTVMDLVKEGLAEPEVEEALSAHGIDNVATSGVRIYTTVEKDIQDSALYALRKELSRLDVQLRGYDHRAIQKSYAGLPFASDYERRPGGFLIGRVIGISQGATGEVRVSFAQDEALQGTIDRHGLLNLAAPLAKFSRQRWAVADHKDVRRLLEQFSLGDLVLVSVREVDTISGQYLLDLEKYPELQGGVLVLQEGLIRAMVGGMDNRHYNRAIAAKRPVGSVMKPLVYTAAMQLGWNSLDALNNQRDLFVYQHQAYFPRPDHDSPHKWVSMSWAGVHSENVASVWLLYHLCDHLAPAQLYEVAAQLGLGPGVDETYQQYAVRLRDELGIVVNRDALRQAAFARAVVQVEPDLVFDGKLNEAEVLRGLHYGTGFEQFRREVDKEFFGPKADRRETDEGRVRRQVLRRNFLRLELLRQDLARLAEAVRQEEGAGATHLYFDRAGARIVYTDERPAEAWEPIGWAKLRGMLRSLPEERRPAFWQEVSLDGLLTPATLVMVGEALEKEYQRLDAQPSYSLEVLSQIRDFKVLVALRYLIGMCRALGIESGLEPVLSFPLGSNVISLLEVARSYEGLRGGKLFRSGEQPESDGLAVIARIEDSDGEVIYEPPRTAIPVFSSRISLAVSDIMRNVVRFGTGRYADSQVRLHSAEPDRETQLAGLDLKVPLFGKTGTANRFTNAAFAGFVPGPGDEQSLALATGYVVAAYVGFDDNTPMSRKGTHITGSSGALPVWTSLVNAIIREHNYAAGIDLADLAFTGGNEVPLAYPQLGQVHIPVEDGRGGMVSTGTGGDITALVTTFGRRTAGGEFEPARWFEPYWQPQEN